LEKTILRNGGVDRPSVQVSWDGRARWVRGGRRQMHRVGGPAVIYPNGQQLWHQEGQLHREGGPEVLIFSGPRYWYRRGVACEKTS
jgi:hypothetical protein